VVAKDREIPETSDYTSINQRGKHTDAQGQNRQLAAARDCSVAGSRAAAGAEDSLWLCPIEDRRGLNSTREGMIQADRIELSLFDRLAAAWKCCGCASMSVCDLRKFTRGSVSQAPGT
jgi:hypothetical protein